MNSIRNVTLVMSGLGVLGLNGCVVYPYDDYVWDAGVIVEVHQEPVRDCYSCGTELEIELDWYGSCSLCSNLDLEVLTPYGGLVTAWGGTSDGCYHLGDDLGGPEGGSETVICPYPASGTYNVQVISQSDVEEYATIRVREVGTDWPYTLLSESAHDIVIPPWGMSVVPVQMY